MLGKSCIVAFLSLAATCASWAQTLQNLEFPVLRHPAPGYYLVAQNSTDSISLIDHAGRNVFRAKASFPVNLQCTDSTITYFDEAAGGFVRRNSQMTIIDTLKITGGYEADFHEGHVLANGNYVILGTETRIMNLSGLVPGGNTQARVIGAVFQERTFSGSTLFTWKSLDHINVTEATESVDLTQPTIDYIHVNSVVLDTDGNFLVSCRHTDEVIKVNRATGNVMWRMGGEMSKGNQFTFIDDDDGGFTGFSHQHDVSRTASGRIVMFDNGNLKPDLPTPRSRVVEYEVNEAARTAKRTWEFRPTPDVYSISLGSVQELSNGNFLIGFGSGSATIIGQEVSRDGTVQAEIKSSKGMTTYRLRKALFAMAGAERTVTAAGTTTYTNGAKDTYVSSVLSRVDAPTSIIVERHSYAAHNISFVGNAPCVPQAMRWVVRASDFENVAGSLRFALGALGIKVPALMSLYHRPTEGAGAFELVATTYETATTTLVANTFREGEFLIAYPMCYDPAPSSPANNSSNVSNNVALRWTVAVQTGGYDVEIYKGLGITGTPVRSFHTARVDTAILLSDASAQYTWRVRAIRPAPNGTGAWSIPFNFRTRLGAPVAITPSSLPDSIAIQQHATFKWTRVNGAVRYRVQVIPIGTSAPALDTLVTDTTLVVNATLPWNESMMWSVRGEVDTSGGDWSNTLFIVTPPEPPTLLVPNADEGNVDPASVTAVWTDRDGAKLYHIRVYKDANGGALWFQDSVSSPEVALVGMAINTMYFWQVRSIGRYGPGPWSSPQWFRTRGSSVLGKATLLSPALGSTADTLQTSLIWSSVPEATFYHVQLTTKANFVKPDVEWASLSAPNVECPLLSAGKVYHWRVMAINDVASGQWSDTATFTTLPGPDDALEPLTPVTGAVSVPIRGTVTFITDSRFNEYAVEFSLTSDFATPVSTVATTTGAASYSLIPQRQYWWHVIGSRDGVALDTGSTANFTTDSTGPTSVSMQTPSSVTVQLIGTTLTLEGAVEGADAQILDIAGRRAYQHTLGAESFHAADLSHLPVGVYVIRIRRADSHFEVFKFLLTHSH